MTKKNGFVVGERYLIFIYSNEMLDYARKIIHEVIVDEFSPSGQYVKLTLYQGIKKFKVRGFFKKERVQRQDTWMWVNIEDIEMIEKLDKKGRKEE